VAAKDCRCSHSWVWGSILNSEMSRTSLLLAQDLTFILPAPVAPHGPECKMQEFRTGPSSETPCPSRVTQRQSRIVCFLLQLQDSHPQNAPLESAIQNGRGKVQSSPIVAKVAQSNLTFTVGWQHSIRQAEGFPLPCRCQLTPNIISISSFACPAFDHLLEYVR